MFLSIQQAAINNRVLIHAVDVNGKFKINDMSNDILKIQKVDSSILYDDLELSCNAVDKTSILKINNIDILQSTNNKASIAYVYNKMDIDMGLNLKADQTNT